MAQLVPWLNPHATGLSPAVSTWLVCAFCAGMIALFRLHVSVQNVAATWLVAAVLSACLGLLQYFGYAQALAPWAHPSSLGEAFANLRQRNQFATLTSIGLLALLWHGYKRCAKQEAVLLSAVLWAILLALGNAVSGSRTGLLQWFFIFVIYGTFWKNVVRKRVFAVVLVALVAYTAASLMLPWVLGLATGIQSDGLLGRFSEESGCTSRLTLWSNVLHLIAQKPWLGWGWGELDFAHFITLYPGPRFCEILDNAHNLPLHLAVELGVPVALVFCAMCGWLVWRNRPWAETNPTRQLAWGVLAVIGLHSLLEYPLWYGPFQLAVVLCIWMLWVTPMNADADVHEIEQPRGRTLSSTLTSSIAIVLIAACAYAAWDYWRISQIYLAPDSRNVAYRDDTLTKIQGTWLFQSQVKFAELTITPLTQDNAAHTFELAKEMLHFSPEPRVVEKVIESATMLGREDEALFYLQRFKAAFPEQHARWSATLKLPQ